MSSAADVQRAKGLKSGVFGNGRAKGDPAEGRRVPKRVCLGCARNTRMTVIDLLDGALSQFSIMLYTVMPMKEFSSVFIFQRKERE